MAAVRGEEAELQGVDQRCRGGGVMTREGSGGAGRTRLPQGGLCSVDGQSEVATRFADLESSLFIRSQSKDSGPLSEDRT